LYVRYHWTQVTVTTVITPLVPSHVGPLGETATAMFSHSSVLPLAVQTSPGDADLAGQAVPGQLVMQVRLHLPQPGLTAFKRFSCCKGLKVQPPALRFTGLALHVN